MIIHKITPLQFQLLVESLNTQLSESNFTKVPNVVKSTNTGTLYYKTLGTSVLNSRMTQSQRIEEHYNIKLWGPV